MSAALRLDGVTKRYGGFTAVNALGFEAEKGKITGFLGPNGAGKTTTLRMILGLTEPTSGVMEVLGAQNGRKVRDRIGFLPEERGLYRKMTPVDAVAFFAGLKGVPLAEGRRRAKRLLTDLGLAEALNRPMKALSKGMAQKVQLVAAIAHEPDLVMLDEPFSGLDPLAQVGLEDTIRSLADRGATVLFSTHVMQHAERLCDKVVLIARGAKVYEGDVPSARARAPRYLMIEGEVSEAQALSLPGVAAVAQEPHPGSTTSAWRITLAPGAEPQSAVRAAFLQGLDLRRFEVREPTLHDAFIVLTGGAA